MMPPGLIPIYKREVRAFLHSASTWIAIGLFFLISGAIYHSIIHQFVDDSLFAAQNKIMGEKAPNITVAVIQATFMALSAVILLTVPILSMRLISAERSRGTFEVLVTCPVSDWAILLGKYFAMLTVGLLIVTLTTIYPLVTWIIGRDQGAVPQLPVVIGCHLGLFFIFSTYSAFGLMASSLTRSQVTASIVTLVGLLFWNILGDLPVTDPLLELILQELSAARHTEKFTKGLITLRDFAFYVLSAWAFLFVAARTLEARRWRLT